MTRFDHLEFDGPTEARPRTSAKGAEHYLAEAQAAFEEGDFEQALRLYGRVLEYNPHCVAAWTGQVRMLIELERFAEAKAWADKALEKFPRHAELLAAKGVLLARMGELQAALSFSDAALDEDVDSPYIWLARGDVLLARQEKQAEFCFGKALAMAARDWLLHWLASRIHAFYKKLAMALKYAQQALALAPTRAVVWLQLGLCQQGLGLFSAAQHSFAQARQLNPRFAAVTAQVTAQASTGLLTRLRGVLQQWLRP
jgi:tetratricopeptide (TPR) repeat protein